MNTFKIVIIFLCAIGVLIGLTPAVWAGGAGGVFGCCVVENPGGGATALNGTMAVVFTPPDGVTANCDIKLRLVKGGQVKFFQLNLIGDIEGLDNFEFVCFVLNPDEPPPPSADSVINLIRVNYLVNNILSEFFPDSGMTSENTKLVITRKSISLTDGNAGGPIGDTGRSAAIGDVQIYVADKPPIRYEQNFQCR